MMEHEDETPKPSYVNKLTCLDVTV